MVKRYIKKPPVVEGIRWTGYNFDEIQDFVGTENVQFRRETNPPRIHIVTRYQALYLMVGDYIVKNSYGSFEAYTKGYFEETFWEVTE